MPSVGARPFLHRAHRSTLSVAPRIRLPRGHGGGHQGILEAAVIPSSLPPPGGSELFPLAPGDCARAAAMLSDAFVDDPVWARVFEREPGCEARRRAFFETPLRYCLRYGRTVATSARLEGVAAWVRGQHAVMSPWRLLLSGSLSCALHVGGRVAQRLMRSFAPVARDRMRFMAGREHVYLQVIGVAPAEQGKGHGGRLLRALIESCESQRLPIYLETETEGNVVMYQHFGFQVLQRIELVDIGLPFWEMAREPGSGKP